MHRLVIDPGHGGKNTGATSPDERIVEKNLTLEIARRFDAELDRLTWPVLHKLTRDADRDVSLEERGELANRFHADLFVTIHCNRLPEVNADGVRCFYWPGNEVGKQVARAIARAFPAGLQQHDGAVLPAAEGPQQNVLKHAEATAVLVEMGFLDDYEDLCLLLDPLIHEAMTAALLVGVAEARFQMRD